MIERLKLYGLYKQAMEGDVAYVQERPTNDDKELDKWDAWNSNTGLSRTQAKRQYIETLIYTMHEYASNTPESRELVAELEFVWDQVRNNSNPSDNSDASSPLRDRSQDQSAYPGMISSSAAAFATDDPPRPMQTLSPVSQADEEELEDDKEEEFVDAPVSQFDEAEEQDQDAYSTPPKPSRDLRWRKRVEGALVKMTTEVAALREQLESRSYIAQRRRHSLLGWILRQSWFCVKLVVVDVFVLWLVILYLRRKKDRRLEGAVRVLLGDAVAQVKKVGSNMKVPKLPSRKG